MSNNNNNNNMMMDDDSIKVRTINVPVWLSTPEVTKYLVGNGKGKALEDEYQCAIFITGHNSGSKESSLPGYDSPHQIITLSGTDARNLGKLRRTLEDDLIDYIIEHTPTSSTSYVNPPPSLGRLLYHFGLSTSNDNPNTKDHRTDRSVLTRSHFPFYLHTKRERGYNSSNPEHLPTKKVWMNVLELPKDESTGEYHGRFLVNKVCVNNYRNMECRVDIYGVWGGIGSEGNADGGADATEENNGSGMEGGGGGGNRDDLLCDPYVLVTGSEKANVDKCVQFIEYRIREHEERFGVQRVGGRRLLRADR